MGACVCVYMGGGRRRAGKAGMEDTRGRRAIGAKMGGVRAAAPLMM
jgi:hypothetical protein